MGKQLYGPGFGCRFHCTKCNRHFTSLKAFDAHIARMDDGSSRHLRPKNVEALQPKTRGGFCDLSNLDNPNRDRYGRVNDVNLWEHVDADRARESFAARDAAKATKKPVKSSSGVGRDKPKRRPPR